MKHRDLVVALALLPASALAADHFFLIGGGPKPSSSQAQIEFNVNWVVASLRELAPDGVVDIFFADGTGGARTAVELIARHDGDELPLAPLASVYGAEFDNRLRYRAHRIPNVLASTRKDVLVPALVARLSALRPGDQAMIVYNGHGTWESDRVENALRLWEDTELSVREFEAVLFRVDPTVPVRFILTQCYSGAFARAVHSDAEHTLELAAGQRCGFMAESSERESEGCSASVELGDYRDYTTYFFAGLTGEDRLGRPVPTATDRDGDGRITPFDAHLYTLLEGYNGDLPRSTSEDFLERWQPWTGRWVGTGSLPQNLYGDLARAMAGRAGLPADGPALGRALESSYDSLARLNVAELRTRDSLETAADRTRTAIRARIERRWPELAHPYTAPHREVLARDIEAIERSIRAEATYGELVQHQARLAMLDVRLIDLDRRISQLDKLRRTRMLARALHLLERRASPAHREAYARLRRCEALPLRSN